MKPFIQVKNLSCKAKQELILDDISIDIEIKPGKGIAIMGESGSGKSTFVSAISNMNVDLKQTGEILFPAETAISEKDVILSSQDYLLFPNLTVNENIRVAEKSSDFTDQVIAVFEMGELLDKYPQELSGGEQQRVSLIRAICHLPKILVLDEPFSNVDDAIKYKIIDFLKKTIEIHDIFLILVSHNTKEVFPLTEDILILNEGRIIYHGPLITCYHSQIPQIAKVLGEYSEIMINGEIKLVRPERAEILTPEGIRQNGGRIPSRGRVGEVVESIFYGYHFRNIIRIGGEQLISYTNYKVPKGQCYIVF